MKRVELDVSSAVLPTELTSEANLILHHCHHHHHHHSPHQHYHHHLMIMIMIMTSNIKYHHHPINLHSYHTI